MSDSDFKPGLEGVIAFESEIAEPDKEGGALRYRGVDIKDLVGRVSLRQRLGPARRQRVRPGPAAGRAVPAAGPLRRRPGRRAVRARHARARCGGSSRCSTSTPRRPATTWPAPRSWRCRSSRSPRRGRASRWCRSARSTRRETIVERFMIRWRGEPDPAHVEAVDAYWTSAAEHGMNASTFTARVIASTGADVAACLSGAVGAMSGPLHGGAPSRVLHMIEGVERTGDAEHVRQGRARQGRAPDGLRPPRVPRRGPPRPRAAAHRAASSARRATRSPRPWRRPPSPSCTSAARTGCWRPTSSSGRPSCSTSPRCRRHVHPDVHLRAHRRLVAPTSWSRRRPAG